MINILLLNREAARAALGKISNDRFDAGIRAGRLPAPVNGLWSARELDICLQQMAEARERRRMVVRPEAPLPLRIARTYTQR